MTGKSLINRVSVIVGGNPTKMKRAWESLNAVQRGTARPKLKAIARNPPANQAAMLLAQEQVMHVLGVSGRRSEHRVAPDGGAPRGQGGGQRGQQVKRLLAITGTRADFSKLRPLLASVWDDMEVHCAVVGQHLDDAYGRTEIEVQRMFADHPWRCLRCPNGVGRQTHTETLERTLVTMRHWVDLVEPDLILVHGDRSEALAASVLALDGHRVAHVEGGEVSGNADERIRHAVTKLADDHFVSNDDAARRLFSMGEDPERVHVIGSPEIDTLRSDALPSMREVRERYDLPEGPLALMCLHPEERLAPPVLDRIAQCMAFAALREKVCWVIFEPNSDPGYEDIRAAWDATTWTRIPSMRARYFARLLREARVVCGNSSAVVREAPAVGTPSVSIGHRQHGRSEARSIVHVGIPRRNVDLLNAISAALTKARTPCDDFGDGRAAERFRDVVLAPAFWSVGAEKRWREVA